MFWFSLMDRMTFNHSVTQLIVIEQATEMRQLSLQSSSFFFYDIKYICFYLTAFQYWRIIAKRCSALLFFLCVYFIFDLPRTLPFMLCYIYYFIFYFIAPIFSSSYWSLIFSWNLLIFCRHLLRNPVVNSYKRRPKKFDQKDSFGSTRIFWSDWVQ